MGTLIEATDAAAAYDTLSTLYQWGFSSSSRFAARYRQAYGMAPSQALHHWESTAAATWSADDDGQDAA